MQAAPYYGTYTRLNLHVSANTREVIRAAYGKLAPKARTSEQREARKAFLRAMLTHHENARGLYRRVMRGL